MITAAYNNHTLTIKDVVGMDVYYDQIYAPDVVEPYHMPNEVLITLQDEDEQIVASCFLTAGGGKTGVTHSQVIIEDDVVYICYGDHVSALALPSLNLLWSLNADPITCFRLMKLEDDILVHDELIISRIDRQGKVIWEYGGMDIFFSMDGKDECIIHNDHIELRDFNDHIYNIDYNGNTI